jgi:hypothetical protein
MEHGVRKITQWVGTPSSIFLHTIFFTIMIVWAWLDTNNAERLLLILTTVVSLEAIYLGIFVQMTVNFQGRQLNEVKVAMEEVQESVEEVQESVDEVQETVVDIQEEAQEEDKRNAGPIKAPQQMGLFDTLTPEMPDQMSKKD